MDNIKELTSLTHARTAHKRLLEDKKKKKTGRRSLLARLSCSRTTQSVKGLVNLADLDLSPGISVPANTFPETSRRQENLMSRSG